MSELKQIIGKNIINLRKSRGLTQAELADKLNYSDKAVSKWECGDAVPDIVVLKQLADMLGVTVDYLIEENHDNGNSADEVSSAIKKNRRIITFLSAALVWLIAAIIFTVLNLCMDKPKYTWLAFVYAVPVTAIVFLVFNSIWGNTRRNFLIITVLVWMTLGAVYLSFLDHDIWLIFIWGIPAQIIIFLWSRLKKIK